MRTMGCPRIHGDWPTRIFTPCLDSPLVIRSSSGAALLLPYDTHHQQNATAHHDYQLDGRRALAPMNSAAAGRSGRHHKTLSVARTRQGPQLSGFRLPLREPSLVPGESKKNTLGESKKTISVHSAESRTASLSLFPCCGRSWSLRPLCSGAQGGGYGLLRCHPSIYPFLASMTYDAASFWGPYSATLPRYGPVTGRLNSKTGAGSIVSAGLWLFVCCRTMETQTQGI